jgi:GAF domain-containing protein
MFTPLTAEIDADYASLARQAASLLEDERDLTANAAQFSAFIYQSLADLNWAGFYWVKPAKKAGGEELLVGPFQGKVACARIAFGKGVCGTAAAERRAILVPDVHAFAGHIELGNRDPGDERWTAIRRARYRQPHAESLPP